MNVQEQNIEFSDEEIQRRAEAVKNYLAKRRLIGMLQLLEEIKSADIALSGDTADSTTSTNPAMLEARQIQR